MSKVAERKARLKENLIAHAHRRIAADGIAHLRARDLAQDAGCSLGAIYTAFEDLDALILHVSYQVLNEIDAVMSEAVSDTASGPDVSVEDKLVALAVNYFRFVQANTNLWRALFEHALPAERDVPEWIVERQESVMGHVRSPLKDLLPTAGPDRIRTTAQLLFSAVHGVVNLAVDQRQTGLPFDQVEPQLRFLVQMFVTGVLQRQGSKT